MPKNARPTRSDLSRQPQRADMQASVWFSGSTHIPLSTCAGFPSQMGLQCFFRHPTRNNPSPNAEFFQRRQHAEVLAAEPFPAAATIPISRTPAIESVRKSCARPRWTSKPIAFHLRTHRRRLKSWPLARHRLSLLPPPDAIEPSGKSLFVPIRPGVDRVRSNPGSCARAAPSNAHRSFGRVREPSCCPPTIAPIPAFRFPRSGSQRIS